MGRVVPGSHRDLRNPRGADDAIDEHAPIPGELQVRATAGSVLVTDSRLWHSGGTNTSTRTRASFVARYAPWWLSCEFSRTQHGFSGSNNARLPREIYEELPYQTQQLVRHRVPGLPNGTNMQKVLESARNSHSWASPTRRDNKHLSEGTAFEALQHEALQLLPKL